MIKDDVLVFDCVAHPFNFDASNAIGNAGEMFRQHLFALHNVLTPEDEPKLPAEEFLKEWSTREISRMVFDESDTDMLGAMPLPLTDLFEDGLSPWERCVELRDENPDRTVFWGTVTPLEGRKALEQMEIQVNEYGAKAFKFYNVRYDYGEPFPWRMDDPKVAFPIYEKAQELGINLIGVHKGVPLGPQPVEATQTWDMDGAAANFPDINFVIFHVGLPFIDETCWQLIRYPNLYASIAARSTSSSARRGSSPSGPANSCSGAGRIRSSTDQKPRSGTLSGRSTRSGTSRSHKTSSKATDTRS